MNKLLIILKIKLFKYAKVFNFAQATDDEKSFLTRVSQYRYKVFEDITRNKIPLKGSTTMPTITWGEMSYAELNNIPFETINEHEYEYNHFIDGLRYKGYIEIRGDDTEYLFLTKKGEKIVKGDITPYQKWSLLAAWVALVLSIVGIIIGIIK